MPGNVLNAPLERLQTYQTMSMAANVHGYWAVSRKKWSQKRLVVIVSWQSDPARLCLQQMQTTFYQQMHKCKLPSPTNAQMQTAFPNKCKLASHANVFESKWTPRQCNSKAFCHFNGIKSCLISASKVDRLDQ